MEFSVILTEQRTVTDPVSEVETEKYFVNSRVRFPLYSSTELPLINIALQPIPLDFLRLGTFIGPPEQRKEDITAETSISDRVFRPTYPMYPFTIFHAGTRGWYTRYASSEVERSKWKKALEETRGLRDVYMDGNKVRCGSILRGGMISDSIGVHRAAVCFQCHSGRAFSVTDDTSSFEHAIWRFHWKNNLCNSFQ